MMCNLLRMVAIPLAEQFSFEHSGDDDPRVGADLDHVQTLPRDAKEIYSLP